LGPKGKTKGTAPRYMGTSWVKLTEKKAAPDKCERVTPRRAYHSSQRLGAVPERVTTRQSPYGQMVKTGVTEGGSKGSKERKGWLKNKILLIKVKERKPQSLQRVIEVGKKKNLSLKKNTAERKAREKIHEEIFWTFCR